MHIDQLKLFDIFYFNYTFYKKHKTNCSLEHAIKNEDRNRKIFEKFATVDDKFEDYRFLLNLKLK